MPGGRPGHLSNYVDGQPLCRLIFTFNWTQGVGINTSSCIINLQYAQRSSVIRISVHCLPIIVNTRYRNIYEHFNSIPIGSSCLYLQSWSLPSGSAHIYPQSSLGPPDYIWQAVHWFVHYSEHNVKNTFQLVVVGSYVTWRVF